MYWAIKFISKTLMSKILHISWGVTTKGVTTKAFTVYETNDQVISDIWSLFSWLSIASNLSQNSDMLIYSYFLYTYS